MKLNDVFRLLDAGYTKEEIAAFEAEAEETTADEPETVPAEDSAPEETEKPQSKEIANSDPVQDQIRKLTEAMEQLSGRIISHNINGTVAAPSERSIDDMLAEVINPPRKGRENECKYFRDR